MSIVRPVTLLMLLVVWINTAYPPKTIQANVNQASEEQFRDLAKKLSSLPSDDCNSLGVDDRDEDALFSAASEAVLQVLRARPSEPVAAAAEALNKLAAVSNDADTSWPKDERFGFYILNVSPALVVEMKIRTQTTFAAFINGPVIGPGVPGANAEDMAWHFEGLGDSEWGSHAPFEQLQLYALPRGPDHFPRFLSVYHGTGCAGPGGTFDAAFEWTKKKDSWQRIKIIDQHGTDDGGNEPSWLKFSLLGHILSIPYCWSSPHLIFSAWPSICSENTYDLSGDNVRLIRRQDSPLDWLVVSNVVDSAERHSVHEVDAYCVSPAIASKIVTLMPLSDFLVGSSKPISTDKEVIEISDGSDVKFTLVRKQGRWLISAFEVSQ